jgi:hypothetical protein
MSEDMIGLAAVVLLFGTPIIGMLLRHQRKMAELYAAQHVSHGVNPETMALREEIRELKELVHQQSIAIDNLARPMLVDERPQETVRG